MHHARAREASSLHAAALRRIVQIQCSLRAGYKQLTARQPSDAAHRTKVNRYQAAAVDAFEKLQRLHQHATLPDGRSMVEVTRGEMVN